jgi:predicted SAM-dependent methyltransferase
MRLELGSGPRPTKGYITSDVNASDDIDIVASAPNIELPNDSLDEVIAIALMEHLTYEDFGKALVNVARMLKPGGKFYFDVPDLPVWCEYLAKIVRGERVPFTRRAIYKTIYGHQRFPGDTHASGWDNETLAEALDNAGFLDIEYGVEHFLANGLERVRFHRPLNAHIYVVATAP